MTELNKMIEQAGLAVKSSYNGRELARILGVSEATMYRVIASGGLATVKVGFTRRAFYSAIESYLEKAENL